jgi:anti-anti-sigma factor
MPEHRLFLKGEIDAGNIPAVRAELMTAVARNGAHLVVDCRDLRFIDSTTVVVLLETNRELARYGRTLTIVNVPAGPRRMFQLLGLTDLLDDDRNTGRD